MDCSNVHLNDPENYIKTTIIGRLFFKVSFRCKQFVGVRQPSMAL